MLRVQCVKTSDTTSDNEWQRVATIRITHESERQRRVNRVTSSNNEWQRSVISTKLYCFRAVWYSNEYFNDQKEILS